jgi:hypothetical protein
VVGGDVPDLGRVALQRPPVAPGGTHPELAQGLGERARRRDRLRRLRLGVTRPWHEHMFACAQDGTGLAVEDDGRVAVSEAQGNLPVRVRFRETPGSRVEKLPCVAERRGAKRSGSTGRSAASSEACGAVSVHRPSWRSRRSRARVNRAKAMERTWSLERCGRTSRRMGRGTVRRLCWELGRPSSARSLRGIGAASVYKRRSREVAGSREGVGGGRSSADGRDNTTRPERRAPASSMHD